MTVNDERERVKEKIVKLLNLTREKGASENEAIMAAERAAALMAHFDITATELEIRSVESIERTVAKRRYGNLQIALGCSVLISQLCDCMTWHNSRHVVFFGLPHDVEIAAHLFDTICNCICAEIDVYRCSPELRHEASRARIQEGIGARAVIGTFITGIEDRLYERLADLGDKKERTVHEAAATTGRSLIVVKAARVKKDFEALGINLRRGRSGGRGLWSRAAYHSGSAAGDRIPFSRGVKEEGHTARLK